jgi:hypothetical protein
MIAEKNVRNIILMSVRLEGGLEKKSFKDKNKPIWSLKYYH